MNELPLFEDGAGTRAEDPLALTGPAPRVDLSALALLLAPPAMLGEFVPASPWRGLVRVPTPLPSLYPASLPRTFTAAVSRLARGSNAIGVLVSGGLDSLAVLIHALKVADGRRVVALTTDLTDDSGRSAVDVVCGLLQELNLAAELVVLDPQRDRAEPRWAPSGPRLDALPEVNAAAAQRAADAGVQILLSGDGADELLGVPRFATSEVARRHGWPAAGLYVRDVASSGPGLPGEITSLAANLLPRRARARTYWAANWPDWADPVGPAVLAEPYRQHATDWAKQWVDAQVQAHVEAGRNWAAADAHDALFPREAIPAAGVLPEASPFLTEEFLQAALALPLGDRYHPQLPSAYLRCKAQVVRLLPRDALDALPRHKQYFTHALANQAGSVTTAPLSVEAGLIDPAALAAEQDPAVLLVVAAIERWLAGALKHGVLVG
ncbi:asparagine synthase-related protein [Streptomyces silvisoli]|uniref:Asparagine synthase-related protein n=1 Tax=Streptomyces silvisoli TaxID=3034235 RepID=A0ABT5ZM94_9ACTN|nr:asparagine synthase-related protein [Streptomyces silvisoli]MDF3290123.1 asparagine synthase-related protein [Streptomyces silvisoli]